MVYFAVINIYRNKESKIIIYLPHAIFTQVGRTGQGFCFLASSQISPSTISAHANDLRTMALSEESMKKPILIILCDDGDDYSLRSVIYSCYDLYKLFRSASTYHLIGRLWRDLDLEGIFFCKFAPGEMY